MTTINCPDKEVFERTRPLFNALGDETRQSILLLLAREVRLSVGDLTRLTKLSRPAVSHHIKILREAELIVEERDGTKRYYHPTFKRYVEPMRELIDQVEQFEQYIDKKQSEEQ